MSRKNVEDIYPLSPMQQGMLFHTLYASEAGVYVVQRAFTLRGNVDVDAFVRAFEDVTARHPILRTAFVWERREQPLQVVREKVRLPVEQHDLRGLSPEEQALRLARFTEADRRRGFDLARAPLMRLTLFRLSEREVRSIWSSHHLLLDGWSTPPVLKEVFTLYQAHVTGKEIRLERPRPYGEYIGWLESQDPRKIASFWRERLRGLRAPTPFGVDHPRTGPVEIVDLRRSLSLAASAALQVTARQHKLTLSTLLIGAFGLLLSRYSGEDDVLFGATVSGRSLPVPGIEKMVGLFINSLPARVLVEPSRPVVDWLRTLQSQQAELRDYEHSPLVIIQGESEIPRGTPLFESLVVFENYPFEEAMLQSLSGIEVTDAKTTEESNFPLTLVGSFRADLFSLRLSYDRSRFDDAAAERMLGHLATLLSSLAGDPARLVGDLPLLTAAETQTLLGERRGQSRPYPAESLIHELFEAQADSTPDAVALVFEDRSLTYGELDRRSNQLAHALQKRAAGPDLLIGVCLERSFELVIALYAILKAGMAYVPLDPEYPADRLAFMLADTRVPVLLTQSHLVSVLPPHDAEVLCLDTGWSLLEGEPESRLGRGALALSSLAYVIFTSGSTGRPKGVMNEHGGILNRLLWMQDAYRLTAADRVLQKTPFSFDVSVWEFFWPLMFGARLVLARPEGHKDPRYLADLIASQGITTLHFVPSMLAAFLEDLERSGAAPRCASLQRVFASGEALSPALVDGFFARLPGAALHNLYGPTEAAVDVTAWACKPGSSIVPIGKPIENVRIYLLDPRRALVPEGVRGELYIGGVQVARGYLNRPDLTAERFLADPFGAPGDRLYRTGDVARWLPTGDIEYLGRADFQVKIRGFRIELGEIEAVLAQHPSVREAIVLAREDSPGDRRLVAYVCPGETAPVEADLQSFVRAKLPDYMVPSAFLLLESMPLTSSGKVDRRALPAPDSLASSTRLYIAPRGPVEEALASLFAEVLKLPVGEVGAHDSFFEIGGHSLLATQAISRIRGAFGIELPLRDLFEAPTPAGLAARVERSLGGAAPALLPLTRLSDEARGGDLELSFSQERLWFLAQLEPEDPSYNMTLVRRLRGPLDRAALAGALSTLVLRHEVLRTVFAAKDGRPVARVLPPSPVPLPVVSVASWPETERESSIHEEIAVEARRPFDLATGPLLRARLLDVGVDEHVLLLTVHHIVSDAWSQGVLSRELGALYAALASGEAANLPALPLQYADYAAWQRRALAGAESDSQLAYWKQRLEGASRALNLPADRPRPPVPSHRGARRVFTLSAETTRSLKDLSRREGATLFMTLLAGFEALLHRLTGESDLLIGTPIANRGRAETEGLIGFFLNTLVLRTDLAGNPSFRELLQRVREAALGAYAHQDMPFERLVQEIEPERDPSRSPLFQVMFTLQNEGEPLTLPGLVLERAAVPNATAKFDLSLAMGESAATPGLSGSIEYSTDLFDGSTIDRMVEHLTLLLTAAAVDPQKRLSELSILSAAERQTLLVTWNDTEAPYAEDACIHEVFASLASRRPDAPALVFEGTTLSYRDLDERANQLAHHLRKRGIGPEILVGISMERSPEMIVAVLGTLKAGGAYVPLDPTYPRDRLAFMLEDASVKVLLTQSRLAPDLPAHRAEVVCLDNDWPQIAAESREAPEPLAGADSLAYVIYTSGSTGRPKGVMVEHHGLVNVAEVHARALSAGPGSRVLQLASLSFDASVWEIVMALLNGGTLVLADSEALLPGPALLRTLTEQRITALTISPSVLAALPVASLPDLGMLIVAGEACSEELVSRWAPGRRFIDAYGPTETSICASLGECFAGGGKPSIGKPLANTRILILDANRELAPIGAPGELCVGGVGLARGYLNQPELTAERFITDPHGAIPGQRLYRTGDLARFLPDGTLEYLGRIDHQVKIRGFRVELGEIESVLAQHPAVSAVVVIAREDSGDKRLVAYLVPADGQAISTTELRAHLEARLPGHMVPAAFVQLEALPLTPSGKVDRGALPAPDSAADPRDFIAPRGPVEAAIAGIWAEVLRLPRVSVHDGFFALGGHSLLATQAAARLRAAFGVETPLRALFEAPSPAALALRIEALRRAESGVALPQITRAPRQGAIALSFAQERLWFLDQLEPGDPSYIIASALRLEGHLDVKALERALAAIVARHETLRTTFSTVSGKPAQIIHEAIDLGFSITDLSSLSVSRSEIDAAVAREIAMEARRPFDLAHGPLLRARVLRLAEDRHVLLFALHHIASDGWSNRLFLRELGALYRAFVGGAPSPLADLPIQYADYAVWQRQWLSGAALDQQLAYWRAHLAGAPGALDLPADRPRPPSLSHRGDRRSIAVPRACAQALVDLSLREGATLFMTLLAAFDVLLYRYTGQDDLVVGTPIAGRAQAETEGLIGFFVNTLALRARITPEMSFRALLQQVKETCLGAYAHQDMPFERLVQELVPDRDLGRSPLFQVTFTLESTPRETVTLEGLRAESLRVASATAKFDLTLAMIERPDGLTALFEYAADIFDAATIDRLGVHLVTLLSSIAAGPGAALSSLPVLPASERQTLLADFNATAIPFARDATIHGVFAAHAARRPDAPALVFEEATLSYRELDERANQLAHHLRKQGVGPSVLVGISMHRSLEMIVAVLGTLKAGGAYVPLDPTYPRDRLAFMLEDACVAVLLTESRAAAELPAHGAKVLCLDTGWSEIAAESREAPEPLAGADSLAYVIYTSGSTGRPKGVMVEHHGLVNVAEVHARALSAGPGSRVLQLASLSFDASVWEMVMALLNGGTLVLADSEALLPGPALLRTLTEQRITALTISPSVLAALPVASLPDLETLIVAGEACSEELVSRWAPGRRFIDAYGPTETSICASLGECFAGGGKPSIGKPIANVRILVLDPARNLAPIGVPGELCVGGVGLARGYLNLAALTAERFVADPFLPGERLYRTGDLARFLPDGTLEYLGRIDHQVKIRGFRVELGEIESVLAQHPAVSAAVVVAREDRGDKRLVAYVVAGDLPLSDLKVYLRDALPEYMVPAVIVRLGAMPLTPSGKIDHHALPAPDLAAEPRVHVAPRGPVEESLAAIFGEVLHVVEVSAYDSFFDLGGHSLLATQAIARIRSAFGVDLPLRALFEASTPAALAVRIADAQRAGGSPAAPALVRVPREGGVAISFAQERLWFLDQLEPRDPSYVVPLAMRLEGPLDVAALARALDALVARHEVLRTTFTSQQGLPVAVIHDHLETPLPVTSLAAIHASLREAALREATAAEARRPFDLAAGPVLRARLFALDADDHLLLLTMHHIVSDGWTLGVLNREIASFYDAFAQGRAPSLPELPVQYADYAAWQRRWLAGDVLASQLAYWRERLAGAPRALVIPVDRPRPPVQSHRGDHRLFRLSAETTEALGALARREGVTLFMLLLAAFDVLLARTTGQSDVVVGTPVAGRTQAETEGLMGFFINTLVLRTEVGSDLSFTSLLARVRETCLGAYAHQDMPFERLVQELEPERDMSRAPLFQVLFTLQNAPREAMSLSGLTLRREMVESRAAKFDLTLTLAESGGFVGGALEFATDLFDGATIERMLAHYQTLLEGIAASPESHVAALPLLPASERQLLLGWSDTKATFPVETTLHGLFEEQVDRTPDAVALRFEGRSVTYRELDERANHLAHHLLQHGVGKDVLVGLAVHRSLEMVIGILGILKAGGAYVPLDPEYPKDRLAFMIEDSRIAILLTEDALAPSLPAHQARVMRLDADWPRIARERGDRPVNRTVPGGLAYVIYTSGSTGKPKGALITHANVVRLFRATQEQYRFDASDVWTLFHSYAFDFSVWEIWGALLHGGRVVIVPYWISRDPSAFYQLLGEEGVTVLNQTPSAFRQLTHVDASAAPAAAETLRLRYVIFGGEALDLGDLRGFWERHGDTRPQLVNMYGITETTVHVTYRPVGKADLQRPWSSVIGKPLPDLQVYVLDAQRELAPIGVPGEMYVGGAGVALGYLRRPELTRERFLPDPFRPGQRLYRTGDLARILANGDIEYLGRIDHQVKIRGFRIELGEIEAALDQHPAVREAVVLAREDSPGEKRLVAYLVASGEAPTTPELRAFLKAKLPEHMVPSAFVALAALPITENGKVDRKALPAPGAVSVETRAYIVPRGPVEEGVAAVFADVLQVPRVSARDGFFELGGHSLLATQAVARLRAAFGVELPLRSLFDAPTPADLAVAIERSLRGDAASGAPPFVRADRDAPLALSFAQERLWVLSQLEPDDTSYLVPLALRLVGALDRAALQRALAALVARHEVLRTAFTTVEGRPAQVIRAALDVPLPLTVLSEGTREDQEAALDSELSESARRPFDLAAGPLLRARLFQLGEQEHVLGLTMHHIVFDAWSRGVANREIGAFYRAFASGAEPDLPPLSLQYADYAAWQRAFLAGDALAHQLAYWKQALGGAPGVLDLPTDRPRPAVPLHRGERRFFTLAPSLGERLNALARREGVTLFMLLLAAFDVLLHRTTGQGDLVVGTPIANRTRAETEEMIGFFVNTLVLRARLDGDLSFQALLRQVREVCLGAYAHQDLPFERLVTELAPERDLSRSPLFQVLFALQNAPIAKIALPGLQIEGLMGESATSKFDLTLVMGESAEGLVCSFEYDVDLFDGATIDRMLEHLRALLQGIVADPSARIGDLPLLSEAERRLLTLCNDVDVVFPAETSIHALFEQQVDRTPDAPALTVGDRTLTYRELDERGNQLARLLVRQGVTPGARVGLCLPRSLAMMVGILGILKAGAAYVPLDPEYPKPRLGFMIADAAVPILITDAALVEAIPAHGAAVILLDEGLAILDGESADRLAVPHDPRRVAYVIYTSGSTGKPKGAMVSHANVARLFAATDAWFGFGAADVWTMFHSYAFDFSVWEIWGALLHGGRLVLVPYWISREPAAFYQLLGDEGVTVLNQTPSAFRQLAHVDEIASPAETAKLRLRCVIFGGEALDLGDLRGWWERHGDTAPQLVNMYGITETTVHVTYRPVNRADLERPWSSVIGRPIPDLQVHVLDARQKLAPIGVPGEMYVGGAGVALGYLARPELTAERFLPDPFHPSPGARLYRTGDLARVLASGDIEYLGRIDQQVKIRGFRIELGEIEAALDQHPAVREAVVLAREDAPGEKRLVAYLVCREGPAPTVGELRAFVKERLPDSMVPAAFVLLAALPLTENGKVDRRALPAPEEGERAALGAELVAPSTSAEEALARIWASVLRVPAVGVRDNFFEIGGDSILSIQIVARAQQAGFRITPRQIFQHPTIAELAEVVGFHAEVAAEQGAVTGEAKLTPIQRWWWEQRLVDPHHHNQSSFLEVPGGIDAGALEEALAALLAHHDALRVRLAGEVQSFAPPGGPPPLARIDLASVPEESRRSVIEKAAAEAQTSLDLTVGPVLGAVLFEGGSGEAARLLLVIHHLAVDGVSWRILLDDLWTAYEQRRRGEAIALPPKTTSFKRWAEEIDAYAHGEAVAAEADFWRDPVRARAGRVPVDHRDGENTEATLRVVALSLSAEETQQLLREAPEAYQTQINDLLLTAFAQVFGAWTRSDVTLVDLEGHGREELFEDVDLTRTVGWFTTVFPVVIVLVREGERERDEGPGAAIKSVKEQLRAVPGRGVGHGVLRYLRGGAVSAELAALPEAEVSFNYLGQLDQALPEASPFRWARESSGPTHSPRAARRYLLDCNVSVSGGALTARFLYSEARHDRASIEGLAARYMEALRDLVAHCLSPEAGGYTPSDFQQEDLTQDVIDMLAGLDDD